jgi:uncharacterized protein YecE (DUF72 family)
MAKAGKCKSLEGAKRIWICLNNDYEAHAPENAANMRRLLAGFAKPRPKASPAASLR